MSKKLTIALFSLVVLAALAVMPAAANINILAQGDTVFVGEEGLDVTACFTSGPAFTAVAWWAPGTSWLLGDEPAKIVDASVTFPYYIGPATFGDYEGNWYEYDPVAGVTSGVVAFRVERVDIDVRVIDYDQGGKEINDGSTIKGNIVGFTLDTNLNSLYNQRAYVPGADTGIVLKVKAPDGSVSSALVDDAGVPITITDLPKAVPMNTLYQIPSSFPLATYPFGIWDTGNALYTKGTYTIWAECNANKMKDNDPYGDTASASYELTLSSDVLTIEASADKVIRNNDFAVTIYGQPSKTYFLWFSGTSSMTSAPGDQPPIIKDYQTGVRLANIADVPTYRAYQYKTGATIGMDIPNVAFANNPVTGVKGWRNYVAVVTLDKGGKRTVGMGTSTDTNEGTYKIRVQNIRNVAPWNVAPYNGWATSDKYDTVKISVEKGDITITASGDKSYYLGEEVTFEGDNTDTSNTWLFMTGPNLNQNGVHLDNPNRAVSNVDPIWNPVDVIDDKWDYKWDTSTLDIDAGTYTVYAVSTKWGKNNLGAQDVKYDTVSIVIKKPFVKASVSASTVAKGDDLKIEGTAEGNPVQGVNIWILGKNYAGPGALAGPVNENVEDDGTFEYKLQIPATMASGQYFVVVQHPMYNNIFDVRAANGPIVVPVANGAQVLNIPAGQTWVYDPAGAYFVLDGTNSLQGSDAANALVNMMNSPDVDDTYTKLTFLVEEPWIMIDPIGDHYVGDTFTITGTTNLAVDDEFLVEIVSSSFQPTDKTQSGEFSGTSGTILVTKGDTYNEWAFDVDASTFKPDEYIVSVESIDAGTTATDLFNVLAAPEPTEEPTVEPTEEPTEEPTTEVPTTTPEPSPGFGALIALAGLGAVAVLVLRKH